MRAGEQSPIDISNNGNVGDRIDTMTDKQGTFRVFSSSTKLLQAHVYICLEDIMPYVATIATTKFISLALEHEIFHCIQLFESLARKLRHLKSRCPVTKICSIAE